MSFKTGPREITLDLSSSTGSRLMKNLAANLRRGRISKGLSQSDLEEKSGVSRLSISNFESAKGNTTLGMITRLANALGVSEESLIKECRSNEE